MKLPDNAVILGRGNTFRAPSRGFAGWARNLSGSDDAWYYDPEFEGDYEVQEYAAPADSEVVAMNNPFRLEAGKQYVTTTGDVTSPLTKDQQTGLFIGTIGAVDVFWFPTGECVDHGNPQLALVKQFEIEDVARGFEQREHRKAERSSAFTPATDAVNHPSHYTAGGIEAIDGIESAISGLTGAEAWLTANVLKYCWRWRGKNGLEDLRKAEWYLKRLIARLEGSNE